MLFYLKARRDQETRYSLLADLLPVLLHTSIGGSDQIQWSDRRKAMDGVQTAIYNNVFQVHYKADGRRQLLLDQLEARKKEQAELDYVNWVASENFKIEDWFAKKDLDDGSTE